MNERPRTGRIFADAIYVMPRWRDVTLASLVIDSDRRKLCGGERAIRGRRCTCSQVCRGPICDHRPTIENQSEPPCRPPLPSSSAFFASTRLVSPARLLDTSDTHRQPPGTSPGSRGHPGRQFLFKAISKHAIVAYSRNRIRACADSRARTRDRTISPNETRRRAIPICVRRPDDDSRSFAGTRPETRHLPRMAQRACLSKLSGST